MLCPLFCLELLRIIFFSPLFVSGQIFALVLMGFPALLPHAQAELVAVSETLRSDEKENRQYQQVLCVAESQESRLARFGALRKRPGYDVSDPWLVVGADDGGRDRSSSSRLNTSK